MMHRMSKLRRNLHAFARDETGVLLAEFLIMLPFVIWGAIALVVYTDLYRTMNNSQKAAYSIADLLSRQEIITMDFVNGLQDVLEFLTPGAEASRMRVTSFEFDAAGAGPGDDHYHTLFSCSPQNTVAEVYDDADLLMMMNRVPVMDDLDSMLLVETWVDYRPDFDIGVLNLVADLNGITMEEFVMTRPRKRKVCLEGPPDCDPSCA